LLVQKVQEDIAVVHQAVLETKAVADEAGAEQRSHAIERWLDPPSPWPNINKARELRYAGTGQWLLDSLEFGEWKAGTRQHLWLHGNPGCGKTVLSTTVLDHLNKLEDRAVLSFYFDFNLGFNLSFYLGLGF
jgi:predicted ATPase